MSASLSAHLVDKYYTYHKSHMPFGQPLNVSQLTTSGPMTYAPSMHGSLPLQQQQVFNETSMFSDADAPSFSMDMSTHTAQRIASLQAKLDRKLGPEYVSTRPGPGGAGRLTYAEGWKIINLANEVFGFNGWSSSVVNLSTDFVDFSEETKRYNVGVSAVVRVTLRDGVFHEDVGYGTLENSKSKGAALDKCKKEAVTDGVKRALRNFGNLLGNCLYDKQYTSEIAKIKVPPPKFDKSALHRRPEFQEGNSGASTSSGSTTLVSNASASNNNNSNTHSATRPNSAVIPKAIGVIPYSNNSASGSTSMSKSTWSPGKSMKVNTVPAHIRPNATSTPVRSNNNGGSNGGIRQENNNNNGNQDQNSRNASTHASHSSHQTQQTRQSLNPAPPQYQQQQQQSYSVTSVPVAQYIQNQNRQAAPRTALQELERSETFSFNSDDDEFLAGLDLGEIEADAGRPIGGHEGVGGAIDSEEGASGQDTLTDGASSEGRSGANTGGAPAPRGASGSANRQNFVPKSGGAGPVQGRLGAPVSRPEQRGMGTMQPRSLPASNGGGSVGGGGKVPAGSPEEDFARQVAAMRQQRQAMRNQGAASNSNGAGASVRKPDENACANASNKTSTSQGAKPRTPSMGGFNFPPGMKPGALPSSAHPAQTQTKNAHPAANVNITEMHMGRKRSVDTMSNRATRQPFAPLDVTEAGDAKRVCR